MAYPERDSEFLRLGLKSRNREIRALAVELARFVREKKKQGIRKLPPTEAVYGYGRKMDRLKNFIRRKLSKRPILKIPQRKNRMIK